MERERTSQIQTFLWLFCKLCFFFPQKIWNIFTLSHRNQSERFRGKESLSSWSAHSRLTLSGCDEVVQTQTLLHFNWSLVKFKKRSWQSRCCPVPSGNEFAFKLGLWYNRALELSRLRLYFAAQHVIWELLRWGAGSPHGLTNSLNGWNRLPWCRKCFGMIVQLTTIYDNSWSRKTCCI